MQMYLLEKLVISSASGDKLAIQKQLHCDGILDNDADFLKSKFTVVFIIVEIPTMSNAVIFDQ